MSTEQDFWDEVNRLVESQAITPEPIEYRLHYNEFGEIVMCSMQQHPESTDYIVVDKETYNNYTKYRVDISKKRLIKIDINLGISVQLKRSDRGFAVVKNHAGLLVEQGETFPNVEYYEPNS